MTCALSDLCDQETLRGFMRAVKRVSYWNAVSIYKIIELSVY